MKKKSVVVFCLFLLLVMTPWAAAQYQSCVYCDVEALDPDPFPVEPCDTLTITIMGDGYQDTATNGCDQTPTVEVRSRRPDRVLILDYRVLGDDSIECDLQIPCDATPGIIGVDVLIDDYLSDGIPSYACGNLRLEVLDVQSCEYCDVFALVPDPFPIEPCETRTITISGEGFEDILVNDCNVTPTIQILSQDPDRLIVLDYRVLDDGTIEIDVEVPCDAEPGIARIEIWIDDDPDDGIAPILCGALRIRVPEISTAISLISFTAERTGDKIVVRWVTGAEWNTLFFDVFRAKGDKGLFEKVNSSPLPAKGTSGLGAVYSIEDSEAAEWGSVEYYLIETETNGLTNRYGPAVLIYEESRGLQRSRGRNP